MYTGSSKLKIAYVSGKEKMNPNQAAGFSLDAIKSIEVQIANTQGGAVDILLTSQWPKGAENQAVNLVISLLQFFCLWIS